MDFNTNLIEQALNGASTRQKLIADNISNANTPGYKRKDIDFRTTLQNTLNSESSVKLQTTNKGHIHSLQRKNSMNFRKQKNSNYKNDENNVDIDTEMAYMAQNNIYYNTLIQRISGKFQLMGNVIEKGGS